MMSTITKLSLRAAPLVRSGAQLEAEQAASKLGVNLLLPQSGNVYDMIDWELVKSAGSCTRQVRAGLSNGQVIVLGVVVATPGGGLSFSPVQWKPEEIEKIESEQGTALTWTK